MDKLVLTNVGVWVCGCVGVWVCGLVWAWGSSRCRVRACVMHTCVCASVCGLRDGIGYLFVGGFVVIGPGNI